MTKQKENGFTLLEVMVALAIMSIGLGICMQLFSGSLRAVQKSSQYTDAMFLGQQKMEEWSSKIPLEEGSESGRFDNEFSDYSWSVEVRPYQGEVGNMKGKINEENQLSMEIMQINVRIGWQDGEKERTISLTNLKTLLEKEPVFGNAQ